MSEISVDISLCNSGSPVSYLLKCSKIYIIWSLYLTARFRLGLVITQKSSQVGSSEYGGDCLCTVGLIAAGQSMLTIVEGKLEIYMCPVVCAEIPHKDFWIMRWRDIHNSWSVHSPHLTIPLPASPNNSPPHFPPYGRFQ